MDYRDKEIRVLCPESVHFTENGDEPGFCYMTLAAYAPKGAVAVKDGFKGEFSTDLIPLDDEVDEYGRKCRTITLQIAVYDNYTGSWKYGGKYSNPGYYTGWTYTIAWYDSDNRMIDTDIVRINLSNKDCHLVLENSYIDEESTIWAELPE